MDVTDSLNCQFVEEKDLVSRYVSHTLPEEEAEAFEAHYFGCDRCWGEVRAATEVRAALGQQAGARVVSLPGRAAHRRPARFSRPALALAAGLLLAGIAGLLVWRSVSSSGIDALARASEGRRTVSARLSGPFDWAPLPVYRGGDDPSEAPARLRATAAEAEARAEDAPTAENLHAAGIGKILIGDWDEAIEALERARKADPKNADVLTDLAAAYLARGQMRDQAEDLTRAYEEIQKALSSSPRLPSALFTRAAILEGLGFREEAVSAWDEYLKADDRSRWADEARNRRKSLATEPLSRQWEKTRPLVAATAASGDLATAQRVAAPFPQPARLWVEESLLPDWSRAILSGDLESARRALAAARAVGESLTVRGDSLVRDTVAAIDRASAQRNTLSIRQLTEGHRVYGEGRRLYQSGKIAEALGSFEASASSLRSGGSPAWRLAELSQVSCHFYRSDYAACARILARVSDEAAESHRDLLGQVAWLRGLTLVGQGHSHESLGSYQNALAIFEELGEIESESAMHTMLAENLRLLGELSEAWNHRSRAIALLSRVGESPRVHAALGEFSRSASRQRRFQLALLAHDRMVSMARVRSDPAFLADALIARARTAAQAGLGTQSSLDLQQASLSVDRVDATTRARIAADLQEARGELLTAADPVRAIGELGAALSYFKGSGTRSRMTRCLLARARAYRRAGQTELARSDLNEGLEQVEVQRERLPSESFRIAYFETSRELLEEAVDLAVSEGRTDEALHLAERARSRALRDALRSAAQPEAEASTTLSKLPSRLAPRITLLEYFALPKRLLIWAVSKDSVRLRTVDTPSAELAEAAARLCAAIAANRIPEIRERSEALYKHLVEPIRRDTPLGEKLVVIADGPLHNVPFGALRNPATGRYLVQDHSIVFSPSALPLAERAQTSDFRRAADADALVLLNPRFDSKSFPRLSPLPSLASEMQFFRDLYPHAVILSDSDATSQNFERFLPGRTVLHYSGHSLLMPNGGAAMLLAPQDGDRGLMSSEALRRLPLHAIRLAILASCGSASGPRYANEGPISLGRSLLAGGVHSVVATLWPIEDRKAQEFFAAFHHNLRRGVSAAEALRQAQMARIDRSDEVRDWAASVLMTGVPLEM